MGDTSGVAGSHPKDSPGSSQEPATIDQAVESDRDLLFLDARGPALLERILFGTESEAPKQGVMLRTLHMLRLLLVHSLCAHAAVAASLLVLGALAGGSLCLKGGSLCLKGALLSVIDGDLFLVVHMPDPTQLGDAQVYQPSLRGGWRLFTKHVRANPDVYYPMITGGVLEAGKESVRAVGEYWKSQQEYWKFRTAHELRKTAEA